MLTGNKLTVRRRLVVELILASMPRIVPTCQAEDRSARSMVLSYALSTIASETSPKGGPRAKRVIFLYRADV